ncbi:DUF4062 domain-containing protein [Rhodospira trueperi]|nr:DUF4062 domain-containing protein [Rhodospira trueperi]
MPSSEASRPRQYLGVMVSSTFTDLEEHRAKAIQAIEGRRLYPVAMEVQGATASPNDVLTESLRMIDDAAAYIGVISHKYGQIPPDPERNPDDLSITELEFNRALDLNRPILLFIMGEKHRVEPANVELDGEKRRKLEAFRERAKQMGHGSRLHRVYVVFNSLEEFGEKVGPAIGNLASDLEPRAAAPDPVALASASPRAPHPPAFHAVPDYIGSHRFLGREQELRALDAWAGAMDADAPPLMLIEAIGGSGKSILTWHWVGQRAVTVRDDWAGRFWYSFYERGATLVDFCRHAVAYMTGVDPDTLRKTPAPDLADRLMTELHARPLLLVLDGLERVLVAYNRSDAPHLRDEDVETPADPIANRDPCDAIRPQDDDLLRRLTAAAPSRVLVSSRLTPRALLNPAHQPLPGVDRVLLQGLSPEDAEALLRTCGVSGSGAKMQRYLKENCGNHPLVIGVLAGLINEHLSAPGNFDAWAEDPQGGKTLNLGSLDLKQRRNHILESGLRALPDEGRTLLGAMSLLSTAIEYETLTAIDPGRPGEPIDPENEKFWRTANRKNKRAAKAAYQRALTAWQKSDAVRAAPARLKEKVGTLKRRGFLQHDPHTNRYDLHPVVRGVVAGRLDEDETRTLGQHVVDHFNSRPKPAFENAETLADLADAIEMVRVLCRMGRLKEAANIFQGDLSTAMSWNLGAEAEILGLLAPFFPRGWDGHPEELDDMVAASLTNDASIALSELGLHCEALHQQGNALEIALRHGDAVNVRVCLNNLVLRYQAVNDMRRAWACARRNYHLVGAVGPDSLFMSMLALAEFLLGLGRPRDAASWLARLRALRPPTDRALYRPGSLEGLEAWSRFLAGTLTEDDLSRAEVAARAGRHWEARQSLLVFRGRWALDRGAFTDAAEAFDGALRMIREVGRTDPGLEACLALANLRCGDRAGALDRAERLTGVRDRDALDVAHLWHALNRPEEAVIEARRAHTWAVADGDPFVRRWHLERAEALLRALGETPPPVPACDPAQDYTLPLQDEIDAFIRETRVAKGQPETIPEAQQLLWPGPDPGAEIPDA